MRTILLLVSILIFGSATAQKNIEVSAPPKLQELISRRMDASRVSNAFPGFRVQIAFNSQRSIAATEQQKFLAAYPGYETYVIYQAPYFKVRVGDFHNRLDAFRLHQRLRKEFPAAFVVEDEVNLSKLPE